MLEGDDYDRKKDREKAFYQRDGSTPLGRGLFRSRLLYDQHRVNFHYDFAKARMADLVRSHRAGPAERLLVAPCGVGADLPYLREFASEIHGIDLSPIAVGQCPPTLAARVGDILESGYPDGTFDLVASPLFFHHLHTVGFDPFLKEFFRVLKPGGGLVALEPSLWHPLNLVTRPLKTLLGNPFHEVEDEGPLRPSRLVAALRRTGYVNLDVRAASFSHCALYVPAAKALNAATAALRALWPVNRLAWMLAYWAEKPRAGGG